MTQTKGFTIFARASTATSPYKTYSASIRMPSPPPSDDEQSIASVSSGNGSRIPSAATSTTTISSTPSSVNKPSRKPKIDFSRLESVFAQEGQSEPSRSSSSLWYILTSALLLACHKEKLIGELWTYLSCRPGTSDEALLAMARHIREACLKASTLVGFPRAINALLTLQSAISSSHPVLSITLSRDQSLRSSPFLSPADKFSRGMSLFSRIYDKHTPRVISTMSSCSGGDLTHFAINSIYGELLAENAVIGDMETGVLEFVCCLADGVAPQAKGHFFGSRNLGASDAVLRRSVLITGEVGRMVGVGVPWEDEEQEGEWRFLDRVM